MTIRAWFERECQRSGFSVDVFELRLVLDDRQETHVVARHVAYGLRNHGDLADGRHFIKQHGHCCFKVLSCEGSTRVFVEELIEKEIDEHRTLFELIGRHLEVDAHALATNLSQVEVVGGRCEVDAGILKN